MGCCAAIPTTWLPKDKLLEDKENTPVPPPPVLCPPLYALTLKFAAVRPAIPVLMVMLCVLPAALGAGSAETLVAANQGIVLTGSPVKTLFMGSNPIQSTIRLAPHL